MKHALSVNEYKKRQQVAADDKAQYVLVKNGSLHAKSPLGRPTIVQQQLRMSCHQRSGQLKRVRVGHPHQMPPTAAYVPQPAAVNHVLKYVADILRDQGAVADM